MNVYVLHTFLLVMDFYENKFMKKTVDINMFSKKKKKPHNFYFY